MIICNYFSAHLRKISFYVTCNLKICVNCKNKKYLFLVKFQLNIENIDWKYNLFNTRNFSVLFSGFFVIFQTPFAPFKEVTKSNRKKETLTFSR